MLPSSSWLWRHDYLPHLLPIGTDWSSQTSQLLGRFNIIRPHIQRIVMKTIVEFWSWSHRLFKETSLWDQAIW
jgi:hypothetical protein